MDTPFSFCIKVYIITDNVSRETLNKKEIFTGQILHKK